MIARVEPLTTARALRGPFDYRVGDALADVAVGSVLVVPFGPRRLLGVVVEVAESSDLPPERLAEPIEALEADVPAELVRLGLWVADEYVSTPARGLALVLPPGTGTGSGRRTRPRASLTAELTAAGRAALAGDGPRLGSRQRAGLEALADGPARVADLGRLAGCDHAAVRRLEQRGLVSVARTVEAPGRAAVRGVGARGGVRELTAAQERALAEIVAALPAGPRRGRPAAPGGAVAVGGSDSRAGAGDTASAAREGAAAPAPLLLHGVTGSGKTEVYLRAVEEVLARGMTAIVLVPEIGLTPQTAGRFVERFGDTVAILHSQLTVRERYDEWARLRSGAARVAVGPRSAVFAPVQDVGLIVVDEEHDGSYKQDGDPRYDARHVAERRAREAGALLLAGSATPRPESVSRHRRIRLAERVDGSALPPVELVAMAGVQGPLHQRTRDALDDVRRTGEKAIVLLNRRGWSNFLTCGGCGRVWECPNCDVTLVLHRGEGRIACHHCGHRERVPDRCPDCGSVSLARHGVGTEQLGVELIRLMDPLPVFRLDADTAARGGAGEALERFEAAAGGVLVGTQMVAKGHDFPDVTLGVVLDADATLRFPDFRAEERTFALVTQLAGRSGRGGRAGRVVVQALDPEASALRFAAAHDSDGFLAGELARREALGYPPFGSLIRIVCSSEEPEPAASAAEALLARIRGAAIPVLGPAPLFRLKGRERFQLVVKAPDRAAAIAAVRAAVTAVAADRSHGPVTYAVDVDPQ
ncbi:MAG: primosomal protein N' [Solirubrobacterales bacterium]|nr:primosomal protein N' [Solirubrobacterales bacterium]